MTTKEKDQEIARLREENAQLRKMLADAITRPVPMPFPMPGAPPVLPYPVGDPVVPFPGVTFIPISPPWPGYPQPYIGDLPGREPIRIICGGGMTVPSLPLTVQ